MTATATAMLNACRSQIGYREGLNNSNKYGAWYGWNNVAYCAIGLTWAGAQVGATDILHGRFAYCPYWVDAFHHAGELHDYDETPQAGDIVFFDWSRQHRNADHVGIVESHESDVLITVEFNTVGSVDGDQSDGEGVWRRRRNILYVVGYGRPHYASERVTPLPSRGDGRQGIPLVVDGVWGSLTSAAVQRWLALPPTGVIDTQTRIRLQVRLGVSGDGIWGPITRKALQRFLGVAQDGAWGPVTVTHFQRFLNTVV